MAAFGIGARLLVGSSKKESERRQSSRASMRGWPARLSWVRCRSFHYLTSQDGGPGGSYLGTPYLHYIHYLHAPGCFRARRCCAACRLPPEMTCYAPGRYFVASR